MIGHQRGVLTCFYYMSSGTPAVVLLFVFYTVSNFFWIRVVESVHMAAKLFSALTFRHTDKAAPQETRIIHAELLVITLAI